MILVPVKNLANAKQRLASLLDQRSRTELAHAMLFDVLSTLGTWRGGPDVAVVTSDAYAIELAQHFDLQVIPDAANRSETDAIEMATRFCEARNIESTLVIPGDIPLIEQSELENIFQVAPAVGSVLVPSHDGRGTNAAFRSPAGLFPLRFGNDSFKPHLSVAEGTQTPCIVLSLPGIALDVDTPSDLSELAAAPGKTRSQQLIRRWGIADLPVAVNA